MELNTGIWDELDPILSRRSSITAALRTMNENPALEWNNLEKSHFGLIENLDLLPMISKFDITVVAAPALVYKKDIVVCGHSVEVNFVTNIEISQSLDQIQLASALVSEFLRIFEPFFSDMIISKRPKITFPYQIINPDISESDTVGVDATAQDSGFETADFRSGSAYTKVCMYFKVNLIVFMFIIRIYMRIKRMGTKVKVKNQHFLDHHIHSILKPYQLNSCLPVERSL